MAYDFRLPSIQSQNTEGRVQEMQSYMYQLVEQLNWALNTLETADRQEVLKIVEAVAEQSDKSPMETFNEIKALIIKSADIVEAYEQKMQVTFNGAYLAKSDFGTYTEITKNQIDATSTAITQVITDTENISSDLESIGEQFREMRGYIKSGKLEDGVIGIEVGNTVQLNGQEQFNRFSRFTAEGIYFYLPGSNDPIAWMSGQKLYITNAEITGNLKLGGYVLETSNGLAFQWAGG